MLDGACIEDFLMVQLTFSCSNVLPTITNDVYVGARALNLSTESPVRYLYTTVKTPRYAIISMKNMGPISIELKFTINIRA